MNPVEDRLEIDQMIESWALCLFDKVSLAYEMKIPEPRRLSASTTSPWAWGGKLSAPGGNHVVEEEKWTKDIFTK